MESNINLAPCPFCGSGEKVIAFTKSILPSHKDGTYYTVKITCRNCWSSVHGIDSFREAAAYESAVGKWNGRAHNETA